MNWKYILIVFILAAVVGGGILAYQFLWLPKEEVKIPEVKPSEEITRNETANWEIYRNEEFRFELRYPQDWKMQERGDGYAFAKTFYIEKITKDPRYIFPPDIVINPTEGSEPDSCYLSFINTQKKEIELAGRKATAWLFLTEEGDIWRLIIKNILDLPSNWDKDSSIMVSYPIYNTKKDCEFIDDFGKYVRCPFPTGIKVSCAVDEKESEFLNQILSTFKFIEEDETIDWKTYWNGEYGFEVKYPLTWKQCDGVLPETTDTGARLFRITGVNQECSPSVYDKPTDVIIISAETKIFNQYPTLASLKKVLEESKSSVDKLFTFNGVGLFEVGEIKEIIFNGIPALQVEQISPAGYSSSIGIYIFHNQNLLEILYSYNSGSADMVKEGTKILSTFKFIK